MFRHFPCIENDAAAENSLYSDISDDSEFHSIRSKEDETYNRQIENYRFKEHWSYLNRNRDTNNAGGVIDTNIEKERVAATVTEKERKMKAAFVRLAVTAPVNNNNYKWPKKTILIASDSMFNKLDEKRLSKNDFKTKVCAFNGSTISEMYFYLEPLLKKEPEHLILHVGTSDCVHTGK